VAVVTFDYDAELEFGLSSDLVSVSNAIDNMVQAHDDAPAAKLAPWYFPEMKPWYTTPLNLVFPDDRDGNGVDADPLTPCVDANRNLWDDTSELDPMGYVQPCDDDALLDAFDWNQNGDHSDDGTLPGDRSVFPGNEAFSLMSTCTGCGIRTGMEVLKAGGRPTSVWIMILLSDGIVNMSDTNTSFGEIPSAYKYGFCGHTPASAFWPFCIDWNSGFGAGRYCIDTDTDECPNSSTPTTTSGPYSVEDYALDMVDETALLDSDNPDEPLGEDIVIYSIALGAASASPRLLRYAANIGDDGLRSTGAANPCWNTATSSEFPATTNCGNYYFAPTGAYLNQVFESIAARIFTKISR
jgi:hypothetical protein